MLARIRELADQRRVQFTLKALRELAGLDVGLDEEDARDILRSLTASDFAERLRSRSTGEWMYVFRLVVGGIHVYLTVVLRTQCVVISFHEEEGHSDEDE